MFVSLALMTLRLQGAVNWFGLSTVHCIGVGVKTRANVPATSVWCGGALAEVMALGRPLPRPRASLALERLD